MSAPTTKTIALISGANQGIGFAVAKALAITHKYHVIMGSRTLSNGEEAVAKIKAEDKSASVETVQLDVTSDESIEKAVKWIEEKFGLLDVLINNAAIARDSYDELSLRERYAQTFDTNLFGAAVLTDALLPLIRASKQIPRVVFVSSTMGSIATILDTTTHFYPDNYMIYDASKAALNLVAMNYVRILKDKGAFVNAVCPGFIATNFTNYNSFAASPEVGAVRIVELATFTGKDTEVSGTFTGIVAGEVVTIPW